MTRFRMRARIARSILLVAAITLVGPATLWGSPTLAASVRCHGVVATIVGTPGNDVIHGTSHRDVINGRGGNDRIYGLGGDDLICGGGGKDKLFGGPGADRLYGGAGLDRLRGGPGNDDLYGGAGPDLCLQGAGSGVQSQCENADLSIDVESPESAGEGTVTFSVSVTNHGPSAVPFILFLDTDNTHLTCGGYPWEGSSLEATLAVGDTISDDFDVTCTIDDVGASVWLDAIVVGPWDPDLTNNYVRATTLVAAV